MMHLPFTFKPLQIRMAKAVVCEVVAAAVATTLFIQAAELVEKVTQLAFKTLSKFKPYRI